MSRPKTKILLDGGDPEETKKIRELLGFLDGQTTNPSLVAHNPEIAAMVSRGEKMTVEQANQHYKELVSKISPLVGEAGVSIEVYAAEDTKAEEMFAQGKEMYGWIPNAYIKYPCTKEGLKAAALSVKEGMRVNITLCFSQEQAAAVYGATLGAKPGQVYVSPFVGRLDDKGENGMDLIKNIKQMYSAGDGHVHVLAASIRNINHLLFSFAYEAELVTSPAKVLEEWAEKGMPLPDDNFNGDDLASLSSLKPIHYKELDLNANWESFDIHHPLTDAGIKRFNEDFASEIQT